jgi:hypothetical protein
MESRGNAHSPLFFESKEQQIFGKIDSNSASQENNDKTANYETSKLCLEIKHNTLNLHRIMHCAHAER